MVAGSISSGGDHGMLMRPNKVSCPVVPYVVPKCSLDFLVMVIQFLVSLVFFYKDGFGIR